MKRRDLLALAGASLLAAPASATADGDDPPDDEDSEDADTVEIDVLIT